MITRLGATDRFSSGPTSSLITFSDALDPIFDDDDNDDDDYDYYYERVQERTGKKRPRTATFFLLATPIETTTITDWMFTVLEGQMLYRR